ncbi:hypothetical protein SASPL_147539 [Salvia splendens]|uniref:ribose-phosphate diphosphokinase n=1 Tax=Salvia splendens TaxID=180675 RepID=A0A8X8Z6Q3_SALSN|nr:hypothetical protein SASPL_147539 [Salvia splendens]
MASIALCGSSLWKSPQITSKTFIQCNNLSESLKCKDNGRPVVPGRDSNGRQSAALPSFLTTSNQFVDSILVPKGDTRLRLFSGTANPSLSQEIACYMGLELGKIKIKRFADGEIYVQLQESVRGCDVYLVQPTCPPANENLMELLIMIDACRRASAKNITAVIPYFGYARADRKIRRGRSRRPRFPLLELDEPITRSRVAAVNFPLNKHRATFILTSDDILRLKSHVQGRRPDLRPTTFAASCAFLWSCLAAAEAAPPLVDEAEYFCFAADCRGRLRPALPSEYFGELPGVREGGGEERVSEEGGRGGGGVGEHSAGDRETQGRESIAAKLVANLITEAGADRVLACDLHSGQSIGYFDIPVDHVYGQLHALGYSSQCNIINPYYLQPVILDYLASKMICADDLVVVSPDVGGVARARAFAKKLSDAPLAIVDKRRQGHNVAEVMNLIGDVKGKVAVMVDDMIDTAGTIAKGAALLHQEGAREVYACSTHAVFSPPAIERLSSGLFQEVIITNTIPVSEQNYFPQLTVLSMANLLGETIWRVHDDCAGGFEPYASLEID